MIIPGVLAQQQLLGAGGGGGSVVRLSVTPSQFGSDTTGHSVAMPASVESGDLLLMQFVNDGSATVATPAGWTMLSSVASSTAVRISWLYKLADGSEGGTNVNVVTSAAEQAAAQVHQFEAGTFDPATPPAIANATGVSTQPNPPNLAPGWGDLEIFWIAAYGADDDDPVFVWPLSDQRVFTSSNTGNGTCSMVSCAELQVAGSLDPGNFVISDAEEWVASTVAVRPMP